MRYAKERTLHGTASQGHKPYRFIDGTAFWKSFVGVEHMKWPIR